MQKRFSLFCFGLLFVCTSVLGQNSHDALHKYSIDNLLDTLDATLSHKEAYSQIQMSRVDSLRHLSRLSTLETRYDLYWQIYESYKRFQTDSALVYLSMLSSFPSEIRTPSEEARIKICTAEIYGVSGMYMTSIAILDSISPSTLPPSLKSAYYHTRRTITGWLSDYTTNPSLKSHYEEQTSQYRDSILKYDEDDISRDIVMADKLLVAGNTEDALHLLIPDLTKAHDAMRRYIYINIGEAFRQKGETDRYTYFLALAAIDDLRSGVREYMALPTLALQLYSRGDILRSYNYLTCSMEDATLCNARLRSAETSSIFPIIDRAYKSSVESQRSAERTMLIVMIVAIVLLSCVLLLLRHKNIELGKARHELLAANTNLISENTALEQTDKIKQEYIAYYLEKCRRYLTVLEKYRQDLLKMAKSNKHDALLRRLKSTELIHLEEENFFDDFDEAFLKIHPHFVESFNALLRPEYRVDIKEDGRLNTELRIYALIRLGITDSQKISEFLNYSVSTIYSYRSKVRGYAICNKNEFEKKVMKI